MGTIPEPGVDRVRLATVGLSGQRTVTSRHGFSRDVSMSLPTLGQRVPGAYGAQHLQL